MSLLRASNIAVVFRDNFLVGLADYTSTILNLKASLARIIIYIGNAGEFVTMSRQAQAARIFAPGYAWITGDGAKYGLESFSVDLLQSINGVINIFPTEGQGDTYERFKEQFFSSNSTKYPSTKAQIIQPYFLFYVNCLESFVFGFDRFLKANPSMVPSSNTTTWNITGFRIPESVSFPERDTVTGRVIFNNEGDRMGSYSLSYYRSAENTWIKFGEYGDLGLNITGPIVYANGSTTKPVGSLLEAAPRIIISAPNTAAFLIYILTPIIAALCFASIALLFIYRERKYIKTTSVELSILSILGLISLAFYPVKFTGEPSNFKCAVEIFVLPLSITLAIATQLCKNYRVYRVFTNKFMGLSISNSVVVGWIAIIFAMDLLVSIVWAAYDSPKVEWTLVKIGTIFELQSSCKSSTSFIQNGFLGFEYAFHAFLFLLGLVLAAITRHLPPEYNQSSELTSVMYAFMAFGIFVVSILSTVKLEKTSQVIIKALGAYLCIMLSLYNLFWSKFLRIYREYSGRHKSSKKVPSTMLDIDVGGSSSLNGDSSSLGAESTDKATDLKLFKKNFPISDLCYLREKTNIGMVTWTPYVIAIPPTNDTFIFLFSARSSIQNITLFTNDWTAKPADRDPAVPKKEPFHGLRLSKTLQAVVTQPELILRFKDMEQATEWLQILGSRLKLQGDVTSTNATGVSRKISVNMRSPV
ncbi:7 transmembrane sweet-taste receptor of 3 GCPR-domain-containing protein [Chytridium lagenaria]|nr:7 transmembrane sweet-taste receptor of 3 GCPR-domain-containing protein [Chytridium lagenaria]